MKNIFILFILIFGHYLNAQNADKRLKSKLCFTENKGQVRDQNFRSRNDILFGATDGQLSFHLKNNGISYQLFRVDSRKENEILSQLKGGAPEGISLHRVDNYTIYRLDINWVNSNPQTVITKGETLPGYNNYYLPQCPNGALEVKSYESITYQNIYTGIDLKWYEKNGHLKYDYILSPGADYKKIQLEIIGAKKISLNKKGELVIKTPLGEIVEEVPFVTQNNKVLKANWQIKKNIISFNIPGHDPSLPLLIDPGVRQWGTYYGGNDNDLIWASVMEPLGNMFTSGYTSSVGGTIIATAGSHQSAHSGNGLENALLVKWTQAGVRIWGTYYGGNIRDVGTGCAVDPSGNVFMAGNTISNNGNSIATPGAQQTVAGGNWDAYMVKFNGAGVRQWGTYYGGSGIDFGNSCAADASGCSYLCGKVNATPGNVIATPGSHQSVYFDNEDAFLVKFDPNGVRLWGTYYGGEGADAANNCATDVSGNIYMVGQTSSTVFISTPGSHQATFDGGNYDAFLVKFNGSGIRQWGTYYGGSFDDRATGFCRDAVSGNLHIGGITSSTNGNGIATDGSHQNTNGGGLFDGFLAQFNSLGVRQWGTYYGGSGDDRCNGLAINSFGYVYMAGYTGTGGAGTVIATPGSFQTSFGGGTFDCFLAQFNTLGSRLWATYYGGNNFDLGEGCATDNNANVYLAGLTDCSTGTTIATAGSHQSIYGLGASDGFYVKFFDCASPSAPSNITAPGNQFLCAGNSTTLSANGTGTISWYNVPNGGAALASGTNYALPVLSNGTYTYYAEANTCTNSVLRTPIIVTVNPLPNIFISSSNTLLCAGQTATLYTAGVATHTWNTGANTSTLAISPSVTTTYTISGTDNNGCVNVTTITQSVIICPVGINEQLSNGLGITAYPNPANSFVILTGVEPTSRITVYNALGQIIIDDSNEKLENEISLLNFSNGIYFIKVLQGNHSEIIKVIKK